ncbi:MAG: SpoIID/LytB domain-containing protein [Actinomycetota bacterium]
MTGHGWGHGVGMSQWGAYGYARHGWSWQRILAHYYPGTEVSSAPVSRIRVLLAASQRRVSVACPGVLKVSDATGRTYALHPGAYTVGKTLELPVGRKRVHRHRETVAALRALRSPIVFDCPSSPLSWNGRSFHGLLVVRRGEGRLSVVNSLALDDYVRGVVGGEMPQRWSMAALEAQAVAARSYALATLHPNKHFDLFSDTRSQVYGGTAFETERTDLAVERTAMKVLTYHGTIATTFFFSTSGGRTADVREVWPALGEVPYLRSVSDPYDSSSPHHTWQVVLPASRLPRGLELEHARDGRVTRVVDGSRTIAPTTLRRELGLQSTWFDISTLTLDASRAVVRYGGKIDLRAEVEGLGRARLERRIGAGSWKQLATIGGRASVEVEPRANTVYRLDVGEAVGPEVAVDVAPTLAVTPAGANVLAGQVEPVSHGTIAVLRRVAGTWKVVAHPRLDARGVFRTPLHLRTGDYRVAVADDGRYAAATASVHVTSRLLASFGY